MLLREGGHAGAGGRFAQLPGGPGAHARRRTPSLPAAGAPGRRPGGVDAFLLQLCVGFLRTSPALLPRLAGGHAGGTSRELRAQPLLWLLGLCAGVGAGRGVEDGSGTGCVVCSTGGDAETP